MPRNTKSRVLRHTVHAATSCFSAVLLACSGGHGAADSSSRAENANAGEAGSEDVRTSFAGSQGRTTGSGGRDRGADGTTGGMDANGNGGAAGESSADTGHAAGPVVDAGTVTDAGGDVDSGDHTDGGTASHSGNDADDGTSTEAGSDIDSGAAVDASTGADAWTDSDASGETDADNDTDATTEVDAGSGTDAATESDAGAPIDYDNRQWTELKGPYGGYIWTVYGLEEAPSHGIPAPAALFAGTVAQGLFRSDDSGNTWQRVENGLPKGNAVRCLYRTSRGRLLAGASGTIYVSDDNGASWTPADTQGIERNYMTIVELGSRLLAGTDGASILASDDDGDSWIPATSQASILFALAAKGTKLFAATDGFGVQTSANSGGSWQSDTSDMKTSSVYALEVDGDRVYAAAESRLYVTEDDGSHWTQIAIPNSSSEIDAIEVNGASLFIGTNLDGVLRSDDGGQTWVTANGGLGNHSIASLKVYGSYLYAGTRYGGVFRSSNNGTSWVAANQGLTALPVLSIGSDGTHVFAGTEGGYIFRYTASSETWEQVHFGNSPSQETVWDFLFTPQAIFAGGDSFGVIRSTDDGASWSRYNNNMNPSDAYSLAQSGDYVFAGTGADVKRSSMTSSDWESLVWGLPTYTYFDAMTVLDGAVFVGTTDQGVYRTDNDGDMWSNITNEIGDDAVFALYSYVADDATPLLFAGTASGGVYKSTDGGARWTASNTGLPVSTVYKLTRFGWRLYAATSSGVFESQDDGETWQSYGDELDGLAVAALGASNSYLYAGSLDGTMWRK